MKGESRGEVINFTFVCERRCFLYKFMIELHAPQAHQLLEKYKKKMERLRALQLWI
jgi:hypothetical protein